MQDLLEILTNLHPDLDFTTETHLIDDKLLDSFDIMTIVAEVNEAYGVAIPAEEITPENFNSARALYALIRQLENE